MSGYGATDSHRISGGHRIGGGSGIGGGNRAGHNGRWRRHALVALCAGLALTLGGCQLPDADPEPLVLPTTGALSTETATPSTEVEESTPTSTSERSRELGEDSIGAIISRAPLADNARYRQGAESDDSPLADTSSFHFTTPDRRASCSVVNGQPTTLACRLAEPAANMPVPPDAPESCRWQVDYVTLTNEGPRYGACADETPVLYRSTLIDFGTTITVGRFSCLADVEGLFCLHADTDSGFAVGNDGYTEISATDPAPSGLQ